jgi:hypothetical protein
MFKKVYLFLEGALFYGAIWIWFMATFALVIGIESPGIKNMFQLGFMLQYVSLMMFWARKQ